MTEPEFEPSPTYQQQAETWLDKAQSALFDDSVSDEDALNHLNMALACLNATIGESK